MDSLPAVIEAHPLGPDERDAAELERPSAPGRPAVQTVAVVAGGFVAGAATVVLVSRAATRPTRRTRRRRDLRRVEVISSRSFLVDVHVIEQR